MTASAAGGGRRQAGSRWARRRRPQAGRGLDDAIGTLKGLECDEEAGTVRGVSGLGRAGLQPAGGLVGQASGEPWARWSRGAGPTVPDGPRLPSGPGIAAAVYAGPGDDLTGRGRDGVPVRLRRTWDPADRRGRGGDHPGSPGCRGQSECAVRQRAGRTKSSVGGNRTINEPVSGSRPISLWARAVPNRWRSSVLNCFRRQLRPGLRRGLRYATAYRW